MNAVSYMENNLTNTVNIEDAANQAFVSVNNFQRIFNSVTGITVGDYIRNRRLSLAGQDLLLTNSKVIDVAMRFQYDTSESFSKAFTRFHGIPPSFAKKQRDKLKFFHPFTIKVFIQGGFNMAKNIVPTIRGEWGSYELTENGLKAKRLNGEVLYYFEKSDSSNPQAVEFKSKSDNGGLHVSIQNLKNGMKDNHPENMETRIESAAGIGKFDLSTLENGHYILRAAAKNAENVWFEYEFMS
jgi:AraC-like DNA-binding protein